MLPRSRQFTALVLGALLAAQAHPAQGDDYPLRLAPGAHEPSALGKANTPLPTLPFGKVRRTLVLMVYFDGQTEPDVFLGEEDRAVIQQRMARVDDYYQEISYGKLTLAGAGGASGGDVFGWFPVPIPHSCDAAWVRSKVLDEIRLREPKVDPTAYQQIVLIAPFSCGWGGEASLGFVRASSTLYVGAPLTVFLFAHEIGHNVGFGHADFALCGEQPIHTSCVANNVGDFYDVMGASWNRDSPRHVCAYRKHQAGWLDAARPLVPLSADASSGDGTYLLSPIESPLPGIKGLRIDRKLGVPAPRFLFVEFRQPLGFDQGMDESGASDVFNGALLHSSPGGSGYFGTSSWLLDATVGAGNPPHYRTSVLPLGSTFIDPLTNIRITVLEMIQGASPAENLLAVNVAFRPDGTGRAVGSRSSSNSADNPQRSYKLHPPTPNPFNPSTLITYDLPELVHVRLSVYDVTGRLVRVLVENELQRQGQHRFLWDARTNSGVAAPTGIYYVEISAGAYRATQRAILLK